MPKSARKKAESGIYHIVLRGLNKQTIFFDDEDRGVFLNRIKLIKENKPFRVYGFCLMSNHVHLLFREKQIPIGNIMMAMLSSFVQWYNYKYERTGNLFQDRFRSEEIRSDGHLVCALRYIHQNPVKAGMVANIEDYRWSSNSAYLGERDSFVDTNFILEMLGSKEQYIDFMRKEEYGQFIEDNNRIIITDNELAERIGRIMTVKEIYDLQRSERAQIEDVIATIKQTVKGASIRQIARVTGISVNIVRNAK